MIGVGSQYPGRGGDPCGNCEGISCCRCSIAFGKRHSDRLHTAFYRSHGASVGDLLCEGGATEVSGWVEDSAAAKGDPNIDRGDYECGVGCRSKDGFNVCRLTVE